MRVGSDWFENIFLAFINDLKTFLQTKMYECIKISNKMYANCIWRPFLGLPLGDFLFYRVGLLTLAGSKNSTYFDPIIWCWITPQIYRSYIKHLSIEYKCYSAGIELEYRQCLLVHMHLDMLKLAITNHFENVHFRQPIS